MPNQVSDLHCHWRWCWWPGGTLWSLCTHFCRRQMCGICARRMPLRFLMGRTCCRSWWRRAGSVFQKGSLIWSRCTIPEKAKTNYFQVIGAGKNWKFKPCLKPILVTQLSSFKTYITQSHFLILKFYLDDILTVVCVLLQVPKIPALDLNSWSYRRTWSHLCSAYIHWSQLDPWPSKTLCNQKAFRLLWEDHQSLCLTYPKGQCWHCMKSHKYPTKTPAMAHK